MAKRWDGVQSVLGNPNVAHCKEKKLVIKKFRLVVSSKANQTKDHEPPQLGGQEGAIGPWTGTGR